MKNKLYIITGQTASGKTKLALEIAGKNNGEIINCDSRQIYKGLDIITGKDLPINSKFKKKFALNKLDIGYHQLSLSTDSNRLHPISTKIWLYDIVHPDQYFSSFDYVQCVVPVIKDILNRGKTPIIVGGTYFYIYHLLYNVPTETIKPDWKLRALLENKTVAELQIKLKSIRPELFSAMNHSDQNNPQRLIRKIEIARKAKIKINDIKTQNESRRIILDQKLGTDNIELVFYGYKYRDKNKLLSVIDERIEKRLQQGAIGEIKKIFSLGFESNCPGLKTIGYIQLIQYIKGGIKLKEAVRQWKSKEAQYAKRQYTFMKKDPHIIWHEA